MIFYWLCILGLFAGAEDWSQSLVHMQKAQELFLKEEADSAYSELLQSMRLTNDPMVRESGARLARQYYSKVSPESPLFSFDDFEVTFVLTRVKRNDDPVYFAFQMSGYIPRSKAISEIKVIPPDGTPIEIFGPTVPQKYVYPRFGTNDLVYLTESLPVKKALASGVYEFVITDITQRVQRMSLILKPDNDERNLPITKLNSHPVHVEWTLPKHEKSLIKRTADFDVAYFVYEAPSYRPIQSKAFTRKRGEDSGTVNIDTGPNPLRFAFIRYEDALKAKASFFYEHTREIDIPPTIK